MDEHLADEDKLAWYCLRTQPKRERIAWSQLLELPDVNVIFPRVRFMRKSSKGKRWVTEPLFPSYLFVHFNPDLQIRAVQYAKGVSYLVKRGQSLARVPLAIIGELETISEDDVIDVPSSPLQVGDPIKVIAGIFQGSEADIVELVPSRDRVRILLEILGRQTPVDIALDEVERPLEHPLHPR